MSATTLLTGASGFLGRHLLSALQAGGHRAVALLRDPQAWAGYDWTGKLEGVETLVGSVLEPEAWRRDARLDDVQGVFHLAALVRHSRRGGEEVETSIRSGTRRVLELAAERGWRVVFVSTSGTVGCFATPEETADERSPYCEAAVRRWPYYRAKLDAEREAQRFAEQRGVSLVVVRPPVLLGPGDHRFRSTGHLVRYLRGRLPFLVEGGVAFADVRDACAALVRTMELENPRPVYHLPGTACSVQRFFGMAEEVCGVPAPRRVLSYRVAWLLATALAPLRILPDPVVVEMASRWWGLRSLYAADDLGYASRDPHETLSDTITWLQRHHPDLRPHDNA